MFTNGSYDDNYFGRKPAFEAILQLDKESNEQRNMMAELLESILYEDF